MVRGLLPLPTGQAGDSNSGARFGTESWAVLSVPYGIVLAASSLPSADSDIA
jgi:hypothetical protein